MKPAFVHRGHEVCLDDDYSGILTVLRHSWHPSQGQLVLSAANDGSLHAWNYSTELESKVHSSDSTVKLEGDKDEEAAVTQLDSA